MSEIPRHEALKPVSVPKSRTCLNCKEHKDTSKFDGAKRVCQQCVIDTPLNKKKAELEKYAGQFLSAGSSANLDGFLEDLFANLGGEKGFAVMVADQLMQAFVKFPGRATNLTASIQLMKIMGMRDTQKLDRELKDLSYDELMLENKKLAYEIIRDTLSDDEQVSFAKQLLAATGEVIATDGPLAIDAITVERNEHRNNPQG